MELFLAIKSENMGYSQLENEDSTSGEVKVDIEALVDQCFQEELANRQKWAR
jgi:hypothetical protein